MKKLALLTTMIICCTFSTWAATGLSFTIWPETSGTFRIWYSTYNAPSGNVVTVQTDNEEFHNYEKAQTGSNPSKLIEITATKGKPFKIYSNYLDAIWISSKAEAIRCGSNNPQLQYIYYLYDNLSPENLEALYLSLNDRSSKSNWGELHLTTESNVANISNNIKKSNAFITIDKKWAICSTKAWTGNIAERTHWWINSEVALKSILIPAIEITTPTTANIELRLGIMPDMSRLYLPYSYVRIDDGTNNHKSEYISTYTNEIDFWNSEKLTVKGTGPLGGNVKIYGAMVSHLRTSGISSLNFNGTTNMRHLRIDNSSNLNSLPGLNENKLLEYVRLYKTGFKSVDLSPLSNLKTLDLYYNYELKYLYYNTSNLKTLYVSGCSKLDIGVLNVLKNSKKLTEIYVGSMGWDACTLDEIYRNLYSPAPSGAQIYVEDTCEPNNFNDYEGSNKTIATNKGWKVMLEYNCGAEKQLTGDGGGCSFTNIPDNNFFNALKALGYANGAVGNEIPTANLKSITILDVSNKNISDLTGIQDFEALTTLKCITNNLSVLDVSKNTALTKLDCTTNNLSVLDVSKNTALIYLYFSHNKVKSLNLSSNKALKELNANYNNLNTLDVSNNTALKDLSCYDNSLNTIDVSNNKALESLSCGGNALSVLDVSQNTKLTVLNCPSNTLTSLDIRNGNNANITFFKATDNPNLSCIYVGNKNASYLSKWQKDAGARFVTSEAECSGTIAYTNIPDANFLQALKDLGYGTGAVGNDIPTANLSGITSLTLTYKDISSLTGIKDFAALEILKCDGNNLTSLDVSKNMALTFLDCEQNQITILNVSGNTALRTLNCADNALTSMNLSKNVALEELICYENQIESIDVSKNTALKHLDCRYNKISVLDLSMNTKLTGLYCNDNELISLNVRNGNNANVTYFDATNNPNLSCIYVDDKTADLSFWEKDATATFVNNEAECGALTSVDDIKMQTISIYPNPTNGILNFDFSTQKIQNINISDVAGKKVFEKNNPNQKEVIDLSSFENGTYIITLQIENENKSFKIIKQ